MFDSGQIVGDDIVLQSSRYEGGENHTLHKIFGFLAKGWTSKKIRKAHPDILAESITLARAVLIGRNKDHFPETQKSKLFKDFKVLVDENITPNVKGYLKRHFKHVVHVSDVGLRGVKDEQIWIWAINNSYDVIFTRDKADKTPADLTYAAIEEAKAIIRIVDLRTIPNVSLSELPLLIHLSEAEHVENEIKRLFRRKKEELFNYLDNRATPYLDIVERGGSVGTSIDCGPTYFELRGENLIADNEISPQDVIEKKVAAKLRCRKTIYSHLNGEQKRNMTPEKERAIDNQINAAVGMGGDARVLPRTGLGLMPSHSWLP